MVGIPLELLLEELLEEELLDEELLDEELLLDDELLLEDELLLLDEELLLELLEELLVPALPPQAARPAAASIVNNRKK